MHLQTPIITLFMILSKFSYIVEPLDQTNSEHYYHVHDGRLMKTKHQHFGDITRTNRDNLFSSKSRGMVNVDDFGAKADGRDDRETCNDEPRPQAVTFHGCKNLRVKNIRFKDAQKMHVSFERCFNVFVSNLVVRAPENSPNTDGIHVTETQNIHITSCDIGTGDDCISIISGSKNVQATNITCGPGHGISIGSLGRDNTEAEVSNVIVNKATLKGTKNGVRIKTWQGGSGYARNIKFMDIEMQNVTNPIIIDQSYCDQTKPCKEQNKGVQLSHVLYQNISGTSASEVAITFECSKIVRCKQVYLQDVILEQEGSGGTTATCKNVKYVNTGKFYPQCSPL
ncbi:hypothetical protein RYX36_037287 [Vicia faba]